MTKYNIFPLGMYSNFEPKKPSAPKCSLCKGEKVIEVPVYAIGRRHEGPTDWVEEPCVCQE